LRIDIPKRRYIIDNNQARFGYLGGYGRSKILPCQRCRQRRSQGLYHGLSGQYTGSEIVKVFWHQIHGLLHQQSLQNLRFDLTFAVGNTHLAWYTYHADSIRAGSDRTVFSLRCEM